MNIVEITEDTQHPIMLSEGDQVRTRCGRLTTPFPRFSARNTRSASRGVDAVDAWLIANAREAVRARGDRFNLAWLANTKKPSQSDKDSAYELLFVWMPQLHADFVPDRNGAGVLRVDNPGGRWLADERRRNAEQARSGRGIFGRGLGATATGWLRGLALPTAEFEGVPGANNERRLPGERQFDALLAAVLRDGWSPEPVFVGVSPQGVASVIEGNTRIAVARHLGIERVPVEVRYFAGGEEVLGAWAPSRLQAIGTAPETSVYAPRTFVSALERAIAETPGPDAGTPRRWSVRIDAAVKTGAVTPAERAWSGVDAWLAQLPDNARVARDALTARIALATPRLEVVRVSSADDAASTEGQASVARQLLVSWDAPQPARDFGAFVLQAHRELQLPDDRELSEEEAAQRSARALELHAARVPAGRQVGDWPVRNVVAHLAVTERTTVDGRKALIIESVGSVWADERSRGLCRISQPFEAESEWLALCAKAALLEAVRTGADAVAILPAAAQAAGADAEERLHVIYDEALPEALHAVVSPMQSAVLSIDIALSPGQAVPAVGAAVTAGVRAAVAAGVEIFARSDGSRAARVGEASIAQLQARLASVESEFEGLRRRKDWGEGRAGIDARDAAWAEVEARAAELRKELFRRTGDGYGNPKKPKPKAPDDALLAAAYPSPDAVPRDVMAWLRQTNQILTSDATDAVRWARIVDTLADERYPAGDLTIYRAVVGDEIRPGDWVTTDRRYAVDHARRYLGAGAVVLAETVDGRDVLVSPTGNAEEAIYAPRAFSGPYDPAADAETLCRRSPPARRGLSIEEVNVELELFLADYAGAARLGFLVREGAPVLHEDPARQQGAQVTGLYRPRSGLVTLMASEFESAADVRATLLHEVVAHYGLRAIRPQDRTRILSALWESREHPGLRPLFEAVARDYPELATSSRSMDAAEEVFAKMAETAAETDVLRALWDRLAALLVEALRRAGFRCVPMTPVETRIVIREIAEGIRRERTGPVAAGVDEVWHSRRMASRMRMLANAPATAATESGEYSTRGFQQGAALLSMQAAEADERARLLAAGAVPGAWAELGWQAANGYLLMRDGEALSVRAMSRSNALLVVVPPGLDPGVRDRLCEHLGAELKSAAWCDRNAVVTLEGASQAGVHVAFPGEPSESAEALWNLAAASASTRCGAMPRM